MARYEVIARAKVDHPLSPATYIDLALKSHSLDKGMRFQRIEDLPDEQIAIVLQRKLSRRKQDEAVLMANRSLAQLGIPAAQVRQIDLHRVSRHGRVLVRSWLGPGGPSGPGTSGDREPRNPLPAPPHLKAGRDLP